VRVGFPGGPRLEWYDRNPSTQDQYFVAGATAPHISTQRWSYTVPAGKKVILRGLIVHLRRSGAATLLGVAAGYMRVGVNELLRCFHYDNTLGSMEHDNIALEQLYLAGVALTGWTFDLSTGGTMEYLLNCVLTEFDA